MTPNLKTDIRNVKGRPECLFEVFSTRLPGRKMARIVKSIRDAIDFLTTARHKILTLIIYMKELLDSDWLRAVQFKCNTSAKSVAPVQITHRNCIL